MADIKILIVVDGIFRLGAQDQTDDTFTISNLISALGSTSPNISVETANRNDTVTTPDLTATIAGNFNFATTVPNLSVWNEIWMFGYSGTNNQVPTAPLKFIGDDEIAAIAQFMENGGGILAAGDHDGLGSLMCGLIPRVRTMRKWFSILDTDIPAGAPPNWPSLGKTRADTLQPSSSGTWNFDNQSDDIPQPLTFPSGMPHPILQTPSGGPISKFPDHMHEGEVLGIGGVPASVPWTFTDTLSFAGTSFIEYPTLGGHQERPAIIATGSVIVGHPTPVSGATCEIANFVPATTPTAANTINILSVYDGQTVNVGRVITDSSFHHYLDLNLIGDPCGGPGTTQGFKTPAGMPIYDDMTTFYINAAQWLAGPHVNIAVTFLLVRNPISQDEVDARRKLGNSVGGLPIQDAFQVIVDGFTALGLGIHNAQDQGLLSVPSPANGMIITCTGNTADTGIYSNQIQRFTFSYEINFPNDSTFTAFTGESQTFPLTATVGTGPYAISGSALLTLIKNPDPFILHGDTPWLSIDLRVFPVRAGGTAPNTNNPTTMGSNAQDAPQFIQQLMQTITPDQFDGMLTDEQASALYTQPVDESQDSVFNFALAKVHYIGVDPNPFSVSVFFRLFPTQTTSVDYDYTTSLTQAANYRRATNPNDNQPIPLAGFQGNEYTTIPFFAAPRISNTSMNMQTDPNNVQVFQANANGSEVIHFFGCWLDINQPFKPDPSNPTLTIQNNVLPLQVPTNIDGPFTDAVPIQSLVRGLHECLIAEIFYEPTPIPLGSNPGNWDKLAQRNIAWSDAGSATAVTTIDIKPTLPNLPLGQTPDELMIDWGNTRSDGLAQIYLPAVSIVDVLKMATDMYALNRLTQVDNHTVGCPVGGISYIPIPPGLGINYAGLFTIDMPDNLPKGESFTIAVSQLTNASGQLAPTPPIPPVPQIQTQSNAVVLPQTINWRRICGSFQLTIPIRDKAAILPREEINLSVLRYIAQTIPVSSRWHPVFLRYVEVNAGRVATFGGDPTTILPSPIGTGRRGQPPPGPWWSCTCECSPCVTNCCCRMM
jgi:hypothetical protein